MTRRLVRTGKCFRCYHTWRMRLRRPERCPSCKSRFYDVPRISPIHTGSGLGIDEIIVPRRDRILEIARRHGVEALWVFGSVRRREALKHSDVDLVVRWRQPVGLLREASLLVDLEAELGRKVDLVQWGGIHWAIEPRVRAEAVPL